MQNSLVDILIDARDWAEQRTEIMARESTNSSWADDIAWSDDEASFIANALTGDGWNELIDGLIRYGLDVIAVAQAEPHTAAERQRVADVHDQLTTNAQGLLNRLLGLDGDLRL